MILKKSLTILAYTFGSIIICLVFYIFLSFIFSLIPQKKYTLKGEKEIDIYIISNDVHVEIVVPLKISVYDWKKFYDFSNNTIAPDDFEYISFGYGDRKFFVETPTWADLTFSTAFNAIIIPSKTAMHVTLYKQIPTRVSKCIHAKINASGYEKLIEYIQEGFELDNTEKPILIPETSYWTNDGFYEGSGKYTMIKTCNEWSNRALKRSGLKVCVWSPFGKGIFYQLEK